MRAALVEWLRRHRIALAVATGNGIALGFGRFAYNALLPQMREGLGASSAAMALLATINVGGYVAGSALSSGALGRWRADRVTVTALGVIALGFVALALTPSFAPALVTMGVVGTSSAFIFVGNIGVLGRAVGASRGVAFGIATAGIGAGNVLASVIAAGVASLGATGWRLAYGSFAVMTVVAGLSLAAPLRRAVTAADGQRPTPGASRGDGKWIDAPRKLWIFPSYMAWGLTFIIYTTFLATFLVDERGVATGTAAGINSLIGFTTIGGGLLVGPLSDRFGRRRMLQLTFLAGGISVGVLLGVRDHLAYVASALAFGIPVSGVGTLAMSFISDTWPDEEVGPVFGRLTVAFGIMIVVGPTVTAGIVERTGSLELALGLALLAVLLGLGATAMLPGGTRPPTAGERRADGSGADRMQGAGDGGHARDRSGDGQTAGSGGSRRRSRCQNP